MKPTLQQIAEAYPDMTISVKLSDLLDSFRQIAEEIYEKREEEIRVEKEDVLITREEAMNQLGVSSSTLWRWDKEKYLCSVKIGALRRYHQKDIDALKDKRGGWR